MQQLFLQVNATNENLFYSNGKIYVVVICGIIIFLGIVAYLVYLDKKYSKQ